MFPQTELSLEYELHDLLKKIDEKKVRLDGFRPFPSHIVHSKQESQLARQGKIDAYKEGRKWYTTEKAIQDYIENRRRKR